MARGKRTPTKIKKITGTYRKDEALDNELVVPHIKEVELPSALINDYANCEWLKVTGILSELDMLAETDTSILLAYCNEIGKYFSCVDLLKSGLTVLAPSGYEQQRAEVGIANTSLANAIKLADKFGFNPAARTKIEMPKKKDTDGFDDL